MALVRDFNTRFPEFCDEQDTRIQMFSDDAALLMGDLALWMDLYDVAQLYFAAHLLAIASLTESGDFGVVAPLAEQTVDDVTIKQAVSALDVSAEDLHSTAYGKRYLDYRQIRFAGIIGI